MRNSMDLDENVQQKNEFYTRTIRHQHCSFDSDPLNKSISKQTHLARHEISIDLHLGIVVIQNDLGQLVREEVQNKVLHFICCCFLLVMIMY